MLKKLNRRTPITINVEGQVYEKWKVEIGDKSMSQAIREYMNSVVRDSNAQI